MLTAEQRAEFLRRLTALTTRVDALERQCNEIIEALQAVGDTVDDALNTSTDYHVAPREASDADYQETP